MREPILGPSPLSLRDWSNDWIKLHLLFSNSAAWEHLRHREAVHQALNGEGVLSESQMIAAACHFQPDE